MSLSLGAVGLGLGSTSCDGSPSPTSRRLCCCATTCAFDTGYCAEGYVPSSGDDTATDDTNIEELQTIGWIAGFGVGILLAKTCRPLFETVTVSAARPACLTL